MFTKTAAYRYPAFSVATMCLALLCAAPAPAQIVEEDDSEVIASGEDRRFDEELPDLTEVARIVVNRTNSFRAHQRLPSMARNEVLDEAARDFARFMARTGKYGHSVDGQRPTERARDHGYDPCIVGENIGWAYRNTPFSARELAREFIQGWKASEEHRETMLDPDVTEIGLAVAYSDQTGHFYAVQMLGRPRSHSISIRVANRTATEIEYAMNEKFFWLPASLIRTHERCRPTEVVFHLPNESPEARRRSFQVRREASFVIARDEFGDVVVQRDPMMRLGRNQNDGAGPALTRAGGTILNE